ncbi:11954_t:CDS:2, partial [Racocetra persica]
LEDEDEVELGLKKRAKSRTVLLTYLHKLCMGIEKPYKPKNLDELNDKIKNYMTEKELLQKQLDEMKNLSEEQRKALQKEIANLQEQIALQTQQFLQKKGWFQKAGAVIGEGVDNTIEVAGKVIGVVGEAVGNTVERVLIRPIDNIVMPKTIIANFGEWFDGLNLFDDKEERESEVGIKWRGLSVSAPLKEKIYIFRDESVAPQGELKLENFPYLNIVCNVNITSVDFLRTLPRPEKLKSLEIKGNNIQPTTLDFLRPFVNLERLDISEMSGGNPRQRKTHSQFYGSLEPLKASIRKDCFWCKPASRPEAKSKKIYEAVKNDERFFSKRDERSLSERIDDYIRRGQKRREGRESEQPSSSSPPRQNPENSEGENHQPDKTPEK